jgi:hypothetical protein
LGGSIPDKILMEVSCEIQKVIEHSKGVNEILFTSRGEELWKEIYAQSFSDQDPIMADTTARSIPNLRRLACSFALFDCQNQVDVPHLLAAKIITDHSRNACANIFTQKSVEMPSKSEEKLLSAISAAHEGLTRSEILKSIFHRNKSGEEIMKMTQKLSADGKIYEDKSFTPPRWRAVVKPHCLQGYDLRPTTTLVGHRSDCND